MIFGYARSGGAAFGDCVWKPVVLIEMQRRGETFQRHYRQACDYWMRLVPNRPRYVETLLTQSPSVSFFHDARGRSPEDSEDQGALASPGIRASTTRKPTSLQRFSIPQVSRFAERQKRAS